ncbi:hypothetical protein V8F20_008061 [Naviculisporaceae sp. PSN 640]
MISLLIAILHPLSLIASLLAIRDCAAAISNAQVTAGELPGTFASALWTTGMDIAGIRAFIISPERTHRILRRPPNKPTYLILLELLTVAVCFLAPLVSIFVSTELQYKRCRGLDSSARMQREDCKSLLGTYGPQDLPETVGMEWMLLAGMIHLLLFVVHAVRFLGWGTKSRVD